MTHAKPGIRPANPRFSSGPCAKRPGWTLEALSGALLGRSHRAKEPKAKLAEVIERSKAILGMPADWRLGIVPASDTGAEPPYLLMVNIHQFDADQMVRREAWAEFSVRVVDRPTGREVWRDRYLANQVDGSPFALAGVAASLEDLRNTALRTMSEAVDALLDKPEFRAALRH